MAGIANSTVANVQSIPAIVGLQGGGFVITWDDYSRSAPDTSMSAIRGRVFDHGGASIGPDFIDNTNAQHRQTGSSVTALATTA